MWVPPDGVIHTSNINISLHRFLSRNNSLLSITHYRVPDKIWRRCNESVSFAKCDHKWHTKNISSDMEMRQEEINLSFLHSLIVNILEVHLYLWHVQAHWWHDTHKTESTTCPAPTEKPTWSVRSSYLQTTIWGSHPSKCWSDKYTSFHKIPPSFPQSQPPSPGLFFFTKHPLSTSSLYSLSFFTTTNNH